MVMCFVPYCRHYSERDSCSFFRFPLDEKEKKLWMKNIRRTADKVPSKNAKVCSCHFKDKLKANTPTIFESKTQTESLEKKKNKSCPVIDCSAIGCPEQFKIGSNIGFYKFPTAGVRRDLWISAVKRMNWSPSSTSVLCGKHFRTGRPVGHPNHPDYVPSIFGVLASLQSYSSTTEVEESQHVIQGEVEDMLIVPDSFPFVDTSEDPDHSDVPNLLASANSIEEHKYDPSTAETVSQCVIYDKIEVEDIPTDQELSSSCVLSEALTAGTKNEVSRIGIETVVIKKEIDDTVFERSPLTAGTVLGIETKLDEQAKETVVIKKEIVEYILPDVTENVFARTMTEKEQEISNLKIELRQAKDQIKFLQSKNALLQHYITNGATHKILYDDSKFNFFTGLNTINQFYALVKLLHGFDTTVAGISAHSQLLIMLMRVQLNLKYPDLADRFDVSVNVVCGICETMIPHLELKLKLLLEGLAAMTAAMQPNVPPCYINTAFMKLHQTLQKYIKSTIK